MSVVIKEEVLADKLAHQKVCDQIEHSDLTQLDIIYQDDNVLYSPKAYELYTKYYQEYIDLINSTKL